MRRRQRPSSRLFSTSTPTSAMRFQTRSLRSRPRPQRTTMSPLPDVRTPDVPDHTNIVEEAVLEARRPLHMEIQEAIALHRNDDLPFMPGELIVMAIVDSDTTWISRAKILRWIVNNFSSYRDLVLDAMEAHFRGGGGLDLLEALDYYPTPTFHEAVTDPSVPIIDGWDSYSHTNIYTVDVNPARLYLTECLCLEPRREGVFRFLDLPAELRNRVYEMTLVFPQSTIAVAPITLHGLFAYDAIELQAVERDGGSRSTAVQALEIPRPRHILDIARVCKQMAKESIPILYGGNTFQFSQPLALQTFLRCVVPTRLSLLKKFDITITVTQTRGVLNEQYMTNLMHSLNNSVSLDKLTITYDFKEASGGRFTSNLRSQQVSMRNIPVLYVVARFASKAKELVFSGEGQEAFKEFKDLIVGQVERIQKENVEGPEIIELEEEEGEEQGTEQVREIIEID